MDFADFALYKGECHYIEVVEDVLQRLERCPYLECPHVPIQTESANSLAPQGATAATYNQEGRE